MGDCSVCVGAKTECVLTITVPAGAIFELVGGVIEYVGACF